MAEFIKGPGAEEIKAGIKSPIPAGTTLLKTQIDKNRVTAFLDIPAESLKKLSVVQSDEIYDSLGKTFIAWHRDIVLTWWLLMKKPSLENIE